MKNSIYKKKTAKILMKMILNKTNNKNLKKITSNIDFLGTIGKATTLSLKLSKLLLEIKLFLTGVEVEFIFWV